MADPTVVQVMLPGSETRNQTLLSAIRARSAVAPASGNVPKMGGWRSWPDLECWAADTIAPVLSAARAIAGEELQVTMCCSVVMRPGEFNSRHRHQEAAWAGVYYVDDGGSGPDTGGELQIFDPDEVISPRPGLLVMFPAHASHQVNQHRGTRERVCVVFNLAYGAW